MEIKLKDGGYSDDLIATLNTFRKQGEFCDLILKVGNEKVFASRVIMAANSQYIRSMFSGGFRESSSPSTQLDLTGIAANISVVEQCINSLYSGSIILTNETIIDIFILASYLTLDKIFDCCKYYALKTLHLDMVFDYYYLTRQIQIFELYQLVIAILKSRFHDVYVLDHLNNIGLSDCTIKELLSQGVFKFCTSESLSHFLDKNNVADEIRNSVLSLSADKDVTIPDSQERHCLLVIAELYKEGVDNKPTSVLPESTEKNENSYNYLDCKQIALVIYDVSRRVWLDLGEVTLPRDLKHLQGWKSVHVGSNIYFINKEINFGLKLCLEKLTWTTFSIELILEGAKDPIKFIEPVELNGTLYILVITSTLSNTSHMWIKILKFFKMTEDISFTLVYEDIRHCHDELELHLLGKTDLKAYFCESSPCVPLMFQDMSGISIEECYHFDSRTEEIEHYNPPLNITTPAFIVTENNADDIYIVNNATSMYRCDNTDRFWNEVQPTESDSQLTEDSQLVSELKANIPSLWDDVDPLLTENHFELDDFISNISYTFKNNTIWIFGSQLRHCNNLVEMAMINGQFVKTYHPPPPYMKCSYIHVGDIKTTILTTLKQASFQRCF